MYVLRIPCIDFNQQAYCTFCTMYIVMCTYPYTRVQNITFLAETDLFNLKGVCDKIPPPPHLILQTILNPAIQTKIFRYSLFCTVGSFSLKFQLHQCLNITEFSNFVIENLDKIQNCFSLIIRSQMGMIYGINGAQNLVTQSL